MTSATPCDCDISAQGGQCAECPEIPSDSANLPKTLGEDVSLDDDYPDSFFSPDGP